MGRRPAPKKRKPNGSPSKHKSHNLGNPKKPPAQKNQSGSRKHSASSLDVSRRTRHFKSGTKALREIKALQRTTNLLVPKASFCRVVREIMDQFSYLQLRIQSSALQALQEAAEMYLVQCFEDSILCTVHAKRVTLMIQDFHLMRRLRGPDEVANR